MTRRELFERCAIEIMANSFSQLEVENEVSLKELAERSCYAAMALLAELDDWNIAE